MRGTSPSSRHVEVAVVDGDVSIWLQLAAAYVFLILRRPFLYIVSVKLSALSTTVAALTTSTTAYLTTYSALNLSYYSRR